MKSVYQLWGLTPPSPDWESLIQKTAYLQNHHAAEVIICGLGAPDHIYRRLREIADSCNSKMYLWLPLFSELDEIADFDPLIDFRGNPFIASGKTNGFCFRCPSSEHNIRIMLENYDELLDSSLFDGAFLDRIRFPSFQYGISGIFSCFCPSCTTYYRSLGLDPEQLRAACMRAEARIQAQEENPLGMIGFDGTRWRFADKTLETFFDARCRIIERALRQVCAHLKSRGFSVGLDLFSPSLSYFTGQDFAVLPELADFIKPMLYLRTDAPAGLPYELRVMDDTLENHNPFMRLLGIDSLEELFVSESKRISQIKSDFGFSADTFCGIEYNSVPVITCVSPDTLRHDISLLHQADAEGVAGCWDILYATPENLESFVNAL